MTTAFLSFSSILQFFFPAVTVAYGILFKGHLEAMGARATEFTIIGNGLSTVWSFSGEMSLSFTFYSLYFILFVIFNPIIFFLFTFVHSFCFLLSYIIFKCSSTIKTTLRILL